MKKVLLSTSALALALLIAFSINVSGVASTTSIAFAQDATTPVPTVSSQSTQVTPVTQADDNNDFPWGLLGLLGLAGLAGLRRNPEPVRHETSKVTPGVGVYESKK